MNDKKAPRLAWALCALVIVFALFGLVIALRAPSAHDNAFAIANLVANCITVIVFGVVAALIVSHQPRNIIGWLLTTMALSLASYSLIPAESLLKEAVATSARPTFTLLLVAWSNEWIWWLLIGPLLLIPLLFPTGRLLSPRWRWVVVALAVLFASFLTIATFSETFSVPNSQDRLPNPLGVIPDSLVLPFISGLWGIMLLTTAALCVAAVFVRYRRAGLVEREQIKWFMYACAFFLSVYANGFFANHDEPGLWDTLFNLAIMAIPVSIGIAILRYRLFDIDILIRRTLQYSVLSGLLALVYFGGVVLLQRLFTALTGQSQNQLVTVLSTLALAALFTPLRRRVQDVIDRRFYRKKYDAAKTLAAFAATVRDETDLDKLAASLIAVVQETMQPEHVSLWLRDSNAKAQRSKDAKE